MDILRTPLLDDEDRRKAFFEAMPELFLGELLNELKHHRYFAYNRIHTLEDYDMLITRSSFVFEQKTYREAYSEFKNSFNVLIEFTEKYLFTEDTKVMLHPILKVREPEQYQKLAKELDILCHDVADRYKRAVAVFTNNQKSGEANTSVTRAHNTLHYDDERYQIRGKERQGLIRHLWSMRTKKKSIKNATWTDAANVAVSMGLVETATEFDKEIRDEMHKIIKDLNKYLRNINFPIEVRKNKDGSLLIVVSN